MLSRYGVETDLSLACVMADATLGSLEFDLYDVSASVMIVLGEEDLKRRDVALVAMIVKEAGPLRPDFFSDVFSFFFFSSRRRHTRFDCDWSSDVCSSD